VSIDVDTAKVDYLSLTGHKIYAPKGVGVLYVRKGSPFSPVIIGGGQEKDRRGGTLNVASIVAMGEAARMVNDGLEAESSRLRVMRDRLEGGIMEAFGAVRNGSAVSRLPNTANLAFDGLESEALLLLLDKQGICASSGSACSTGSLEPSHVLSAMGLTRSSALGSIRLSLGRMTGPEDVDYLLETLPGLIQRLRGVSPR
jgi:cysteine desulfurase